MDSGLLSINQQLLPHLHTSDILGAKFKLFKRIHGQDGRTAGLVLRSRSGSQKSDSRRWKVALACILRFLMQLSTCAMWNANVAVATQCRRKLIGAPVGQGKVTFIYSHPLKSDSAVAPSPAVCALKVTHPRLTAALNATLASKRHLKEPCLFHSPMAVIGLYGWSSVIALAVPSPRLWPNIPTLLYV